MELGHRPSIRARRNGRWKGPAYRHQAPSLVGSHERGGLRNLPAIRSGVDVEARARFASPMNHEWPLVVRRQLGWSEGDDRSPSPCPIQGGASTSESGVGCAVSGIGYQGPGMSSPPVRAPGPVQGCANGRFLEQRARDGPRSWTRIRRQRLARSFDLPGWPSCGGPRRSVAREWAVVPSATPGSPSSN